MTDQQIRLQFGEMNAAEMRLARAIVGWHEREQAKLIQDWADTDTAVRETCRKAGLDVDGSPAHVPDIPEMVESLAAQNARLRAEVLRLQSDKETLISCANVVGMREKLDEAVKSTGIRFSPPDYTTENAKLRAAADGLAEALGACTFKDWFASELTGKVTVTIDSDKVRASLTDYQATKP